MKSSHSHCRKVQKVILHSRRFYCTAESFTAQQKALLHSKRFYYITEVFTEQQKVLLHSRKVSPMAKIREKFLLRQKEDKPTLQRFPLDFGLNICTQTGSSRMTLWSPFCEARGPTSFLEKAYTKRCLITSRSVSKVQEI